MTDFWTLKMNAYFGRVDADGDGVITQHDFTVMSDNFIKEGSLNAARAASMKKCLGDLWTKFQTVAGSAGKISQTQLVGALDTIVKDKAHLDDLAESLKLYFLAVDTNQDGDISLDEYKTFFRCISIDEKLAEPTFRAIDTNSDNVLSQDEFVDAGMDFFKSKVDNSPSKHFWGPI